MEYRKYGQSYYVRMDKGDEIIQSLLALCEKEKILSATFSGIGGCDRAEIQTFIPAAGAFETKEWRAMLELVSLNGNIVCDDQGALYHHTHALFSFVENGAHKQAGGHLKSATVLYTAEIELRQVAGGVIYRKADPETGTGFWRFGD